jgi:hypothetical protein
VEDDDDVVVEVAEVLVVVDETGVQTHASRRPSAVHSSPSGQSPRQIGNNPPHATRVVVVLLVVVDVVVVVGSLVDVELVVGASVDVVGGGSVDDVVEVGGSSVVDDDVVVGVSAVELVDDVVGASLVDELEELVVDGLLDVEVEVVDGLDVVVLPNVPANPISTMALPPADAPSHADEEESG